jgi:molybdate transport system substrate-binding protein
MTGAPRGSFLSRPWLVTLTSWAAVALLALLLWSPWSQPGISGQAKLRFYCAAGAQKPVAEIIKDYKLAYGVTVEVSYGGSGTLVSEMQAARGQGDLYLAADTSHMEQAQRLGLVAESIPVAVQRPVLVLQKQTQQKLHGLGKPVTSAADLLRDDLKVILADPERASIGQMTRDLLRPGGLWAKLQNRLREGGAQVSTVATVNELIVDVRSRPGYLGVVWDANAAPFDDLEVVRPPEFARASERIMLGVLTKSENPTAAFQFARYLTARDKGGEVFRRHHYEPISDADVWEEHPTVHLTAGAMLKPAIDEAIKAFSRREGVTINTSYAGCGLLVSQMRSIKQGQKPGRFPDAFFSCDTSFLEAVQDWFEPAQTIAKNDVVLMVPLGNPKGVKSLPDLTRKDLRVGLAHPTHSALGKLTDELLHRLGLHDGVYSPERGAKVVHADAAHLLVNQMRAGALDLAVVYRSNARSAAANSDALEVIDLSFPETFATQPFAVAKDSRHKYLMRRLLRSIQSPESAARFRELGFHWAARAD